MPITAEINARLVPHSKRHNPINLEAVRIFPVILAPCALLREAQKIGAGEVMVVPDLCPAHAAEIALGVVGIDFARQAIGFLMVDPVQGITSM